MLACPIHQSHMRWTIRFAIRSSSCSVQSHNKHSKHVYVSIGFVDGSDKPNEIDYLHQLLLEGKMKTCNIKKLTSSTNSQRIILEYWRRQWRMGHR